MLGSKTLSIATHIRGTEIGQCKNLFAFALVFQKFLRLLVNNSLLLLGHLF